jgi:hypothetical protein
VLRDPRQAIILVHDNQKEAPFMNTDRINPTAIREAFRFLVDEFHYSITRDEELFHDQRRYGFIIEYVGKGRRVHLSHDYKEEFFNFVIIRGLIIPTITIR